VIALEVARLGIGNEGNPIEIDTSDALAAHTSARPPNSLMVALPNHRMIG
jgi:hypothetical protein